MVSTNALSSMFAKSPLEPIQEHMDLARGIAALDLGIIRTIALSWIITLPAGGLLAIGFYYTMRQIFG